MKKNLIAFALISGFTGVALAGCGSIYNGPTSYIDFHVENADKVECKIFNDKYSYFIIAPKRKMVENSKYPYQVHCAKEGYEDFVGVIEPSVSGAHVMNVANAGLGVPFDIADHSVYEYPTEFTITMKSLATVDHSFSLQSTIITKDPILNRAPTTPAIQPDLRFQYQVPLQTQQQGVVTQPPVQQQQYIAPAQSQSTPTQNPLMTLPKSILEIEAEEAARQGYKVQ